jgi:hypothetical protein
VRNNRAPVFTLSHAYDRPALLGIFFQEAFEKRSMLYTLLKLNRTHVILLNTPPFESKKGTVLKEEQTYH